MAQRVGRAGCWIHVFDEAFFGGRGRFLAPGERMQAERIGSIIVGPATVAEVLDIDDLKITKLTQWKIIADFSKFVAKKEVSCIRVAKARVRRSLRTRKSLAGDKRET
jgi:hypothetical protein